MEKKKNKKNDKWEKAKPILLKILHGVSYVFSAIFIGLCVYACASSGAKKENQKPIKQQHNEVVYIGQTLDIDNPGGTGVFSNDILYDLVYTPYQRLGFDDYTKQYQLYVEFYTGYDYENNEPLSDYFEIFGFDYQSYGENDKEFVFYINQEKSQSIIFYIETNQWSYSATNVFGSSQYIFNVLLDNDYPYPLEIRSLEIGGSYVHDYFGLEIYDYFIGYDNDNLFGGLTTSTSSFIGTLNSGLTDMISIFYDDGITTIGTITLIVVAVSLVWLSFRLISSKVRLR